MHRRKVQYLCGTNRGVQNHGSTEVDVPGKLFKIVTKLEIKGIFACNKTNKIIKAIIKNLYLYL